MHDNKLENQVIELVATGIATDYPDAFMGRSAIETVGYRMTQRLADNIFAQAGASRDDVGVVELHDFFAANFEPHIDGANSFGAARILSGTWIYGGKYVVNPSRGLEVKEHLLDATGLAMHFSIIILSCGLSNISAEAQQGPGLCKLQGYLTFPMHGGSTALFITSILAEQSSSAPSVAQNFTTLTAQMDVTDVDKVRSRSYSERLLHLAKL
ncbi:hypothetical protein EI94DRAFT_1791953 [Lactarius quietus]|nr:hypothetical protein EI94DRAFT_1791953 [Lactarius quietus]